MIRDIGSLMLRQKETKLKFRNAVSILTARKFPLLGTSATVEKRLHYYFKNQNRKLPPKPKDTEKEIHNSKEIGALEVMTQEIGKENINRSLIRKLLNETRNGRNSDAVDLSGYELLQKYRGLLDEDLFLWEFTQIVSIGVQRLRQNLNDSIQKLNSILPIPAEQDDQALHLLLHLPLLFKPFGKKLQNSVLKIFPDKTTLKESIPKRSKGPFLTGVGSRPQNLRCYVDSQPLFVAKPKEAVILLMAAYWIFKISFEKEFRQQLVLLAISIFGTDSKDLLSANDLKLLSVHNIVEKANLNF